MRHDTSTLEESRRKLADLVTQAVSQTAQVIEDEQAELKRRFPAMISQPAPVLVDPSAIRDLTQSDEYKQAVDAYVAGRLDVNLLSKVVALLGQLAPIEFLVR